MNTHQIYSERGLRKSIPQPQGGPHHIESIEFKRKESNNNVTKKVKKTVESNSTARTFNEESIYKPKGYERPTKASALKQVGRSPTSLESLVQTTQKTEKKTWNKVPPEDNKKKVQMPHKSSEVNTTFIKETECIERFEQGDNISKPHLVEKTIKKFKQTSKNSTINSLSPNLSQREKEYFNMPPVDRRIKKEVTFNRHLNPSSNNKLHSVSQPVLYQNSYKTNGNKKEIKKKLECIQETNLPNRFTSGSDEYNKNYQYKTNNPQNRLFTSTPKCTPRTNCSSYDCKKSTGCSPCGSGRTSARSIASNYSKNLYRNPVSSTRNSNNLTPRNNRDSSFGNSQNSSTKPIIKSESSYNKKPFQYPSSSRSQSCRKTNLFDSNSIKKYSNTSNGLNEFDDASIQNVHVLVSIEHDSDDNSRPSDLQTSMYECRNSSEGKTVRVKIEKRYTKRNDTWVQKVPDNSGESQSDNCKHSDHFDRCILDIVKELVDKNSTTGKEEFPTAVRKKSVTNSTNNGDMLNDFSSYLKDVQRCGSGLIITLGKTSTNCESENDINNFNNDLNQSKLNENGNNKNQNRSELKCSSTVVYSHAGGTKQISSTRIQTISEKNNFIDPHSTTHSNGQRLDSQDYKNLSNNTNRTSQPSKYNNLTPRSKTAVGRSRSPFRNSTNSTDKFLKSFLLQQTDVAYEVIEPESDYECISQYQELNPGNSNNSDHNVEKIRSFQRKSYRPEEFSSKQQEEVPKIKQTNRTSTFQYEQKTSYSEQPNTISEQSLTRHKSQSVSKISLSKSNYMDNSEPRQTVSSNQIKSERPSNNKLSVQSMSAHALSEIDSKKKELLNEINLKYEPANSTKKDLSIRELFARFEKFKKEIRTLCKIASSINVNKASVETMTDCDSNTNNGECYQMFWKEMSELINAIHCSINNIKNSNNPSDTSISRQLTAVMTQTESINNGTTVLTESIQEIVKQNNFDSNSEHIAVMTAASIKFDIPETNSSNQINESIGKNTIDDVNKLNTINPTKPLQAIEEIESKNENSYYKSLSYFQSADNVSKQLKGQLHNSYNTDNLNSFGPMENRNYKQSLENTANKDVKSMPKLKQSEKFENNMAKRDVSREINVKDEEELSIIPSVESLKMSIYGQSLINRNSKDSGKQNEISVISNFSYIDNNENNLIQTYNSNRGEDTGSSSCENLIQNLIKEIKNFKVFVLETREKCLKADGEFYLKLYRQILINSIIDIKNTLDTSSNTDLLKISELEEQETTTESSNNIEQKYIKSNNLKAIKNNEEENSNAILESLEKPIKKKTNSLSIDKSKSRSKYSVRNSRNTKSEKQNVQKSIQNEEGDKYLPKNNKYLGKQSNDFSEHKSFTKGRISSEVASAINQKKEYDDSTTGSESNSYSNFYNNNLKNVKSLETPKDYNSYGAKDIERDMKIKAENPQKTIKKEEQNNKNHRSSINRTSSISKELLDNYYKSNENYLKQNSSESSVVPVVKNKQKTLQRVQNDSQNQNKPINVDASCSCDSQCSGNDLRMSIDIKINNNLRLHKEFLKNLGKNDDEPESTSSGKNEMKIQKKSKRFSSGYDGPTIDKCEIPQNQKSHESNDSCNDFQSSFSTAISDDDFNATFETKCSPKMDRNEISRICENTDKLSEKSRKYSPQHVEPLKKIFNSKFYDKELYTDGNRFNNLSVVKKESTIGHILKRNFRRITDDSSCSSRSDFPCDHKKCTCMKEIEHRFDNLCKFKKKDDLEKLRTSSIFFGLNSSHDKST